MTRLALCLLIAVALLAPAGARADSLTGRLLVTLQPRAAGQAHASALAVAGARAEGPRVPEIDLLTVRPAAGRTLSETARALRLQRAVRHVEVERRHQLRVVPNDPALSAAESAPGTPAGTTVQWWADRLGLFTAWDFTRGAGARVALIDTGVDAGHPELAGKIDATFDKDNIRSPGPPTVDENGHGTHVASMACGAGDNGVGLVGAGLDCRLIVIKTDLTDASVAASIVEAANAGAGAINMSFGTAGGRPASRAITDAIDFALTKEVVLVAAAADEPVLEQGDPANVLQPTNSGADIAAGKGLTVTAANNAGARASFAGRGTQISLAAFGQFADAAGPGGILGAFPGNETELERGGGLLFPTAPCGCRTSFGDDPRYAYVQGTSMAAPMVAATAALMRNLNPDLRALEVVRIIKETAQRAPGSGWNPELGWGILNAGAAVRVAATADRRAPTSRARGASRVRRARRFTVRWSGRDTVVPGLQPSGVRRFDLFRSTDRGPYRRIARTPGTSIRLRAVPGARYRFYTLAVDNAGNREAVPRRPDLTTRVDRRRR